MRSIASIGMALGLACLSTSCGTLVGRGDSSPRTVAGTSLTQLEVRVRIYDFAPRMVATVEHAAGEIRMATSDEDVRLAAVLWKLEYLEAIQYAMFQPDIRVAAVDLWLLSVQMVEALETGSLRELFGEHQQVAIAAARRNLERLETGLRTVAVDVATFEDARSLVHDAAREHPISGRLVDRQSATALTSHPVVTQSGDIFGAVGAAADVIGDMSLRMNLYAANLPRLIRWQSELAAREIVIAPEVAGPLDDVSRAARVIEGAEPVIRDFEGMLDRSLATISKERLTILLDLERQRLETLEQLVVQRESISEQISEERDAVLSQIRQERLEAQEFLEDLRRRSITDLSNEGRLLIDHAAYRAAQLLGAAFIAILIGGFLVARIAMRTQRNV